MKSESSKKTIATLDLGSNSVLMLIVDAYPNGEVKIINEYVAITRLGENVMSTRVLGAEAMKRTLDAASEMKNIAFQEGTDHLIVTATSAVRNADNRSQFLVKCRQRLDVYPQVLSGKEEARLSFLGATTNLSRSTPALLFDIGGGSTEIAYGEGGKLFYGESFEFGCVSLGEKFDTLRKITLRRQIGFQNYIRKILLPVKYKIGDWASENKPTVLVCGGTATCYAAVLKKEGVFNRDMINLTESGRKELSAQLRMIGKMSLKERRKVPGMEIERAEIFPTGLLILSTVLNFFDLDTFKVTTDGLRLGTIRYYLDNLSTR